MSAGRRSGREPVRRYPRMARVNEQLREVIAESLERLADHDERLGLLTVTGVECEADFHRARVLLASLGPTEAEALAELRSRIQADISRQVRLKRTPLLSFAIDPAVVAGRRIEEILADLGPLPPAQPEPVDWPYVSSPASGVDPPARPLPDDVSDPGYPGGTGDPDPGPTGGPAGRPG